MAKIRTFVMGQLDGSIRRQRRLWYALEVDPTYAILDKSGRDAQAPYETIRERIYNEAPSAYLLHLVDLETRKVFRNFGNLFDKALFTMKDLFHMAQGMEIADVKIALEMCAWKSIRSGYPGTAQTLFEAHTNLARDYFELEKARAEAHTAMIELDIPPMFLLDVASTTMGPDEYRTMLQQLDVDP